MKENYFFLRNRKNYEIYVIKEGERKSKKKLEPIFFSKPKKKCFCVWGGGNCFFSKLIKNASFSFERQRYFGSFYNNFGEVFF